MLVRVVLNSQLQVIHPPQPPKVLDYRHEPPHPANFYFFHYVFMYFGNTTRIIYLFFETESHSVVQSPRVECSGMILGS